MLVQLPEAALRSFALGGAVWLSLRFLHVHNPQTRMTAWTPVLLASLSMPVVMHWATVPIPAYSSPSDVKSFPVTPGADEFDMPLSANGERAGYAGLVFLDGGGRRVRVNPLWFRPSVRNLGNAITNAELPGGNPPPGDRGEI